MNRVELSWKKEGKKLLNTISSLLWKPSEKNVSFDCLFNFVVRTKCEQGREGDLHVIEETQSTIVDNCGLLDWAESPNCSSYTYEGNDSNRLKYNNLLTRWPPPTMFLFRPNCAIFFQWMIFNNGHGLFPFPESTPWHLSTGIRIKRNDNKLRGWVRYPKLSLNNSRL